MSTFHPVDLLNYAISQEPSALGIFVLNSRLRGVTFRKILVPANVPLDEPDGGTMIPKFTPAMKKARLALVTFELPERVGVNLKGPDGGQDFLIAFSIDRAIYDSFLRRREVEASGLVLPPGAKM